MKDERFPNDRLRVNTHSVATRRISSFILHIWLPALAIGAAILGVTALHFLTPVEHTALHQIYQRLYYLPLVAAALFFGWRGGVAAALFASIAYLPHGAAKRTGDTRNALAAEEHQHHHQDEHQLAAADIENEEPSHSGAKVGSPINEDQRMPGGTCEQQPRK